MIGYISDAEFGNRGKCPNICFSRWVIGYISDAEFGNRGKCPNICFSRWVIGDIRDASCSSFNLVNPDRF
ncbi:MAG: hypothetical protein J4G05_11190, partial [Chlorobi bacterium]|nr:hypothetical protein [Chlorobiota bacterium]